MYNANSREITKKLIKANIIDILRRQKKWFCIKPLRVENEWKTI